MGVGETQKHLSLWAEGESTHRFYDRYHLLYAENWLRAADDHVKRHAGSRTAGCNGVTMRGCAETLEENLRRLQDAIEAAGCEPPPVRRTYIREVKAGGRIKMRPWGIPDIRERVVQEALRRILAPIWEADFRRPSSGVRPHRSTKDAVTSIVGRLTARRSTGYGGIVEGAMQSFFWAGSWM